MEPTSKRLAAALEAVNRASSDRDDIRAAKVRGLMAGYDARWADSDWQAIGVEEEFVLPVVNPETGRASRTWMHAGKFDGIAAYKGKTCLVEHKTTSEDVSDPNSPYWRRLAIDSQVSGYVLANWQNGRKLDGTMYDVIRKPGIRPKQLDQKTRRAIASLGEYCGTRISEDLRQQIIDGGDTETAELYEIRLAADTLAQPGKYFQRRFVPRLDSELAEWANELWDVAKDIQNARRMGRFYRNSSACMNYGTPCEFLGVCSGHESIASDRWRKREAVHAELSEAGGASVLTGSSIRCFQTCRRKYQYRYELGIERNDEEERDALLFGTLMHVALEAWWLFGMKGETHDQHANGSAPSGGAERSGTTQLAG